MTNLSAGDPITIGMVLFEGVTQLDLTGPYEVFSRMPGAHVLLMAETDAPVRTEWGMTITPDTPFSAAPPLDVLCVPGGWGINAQLENERLIAFLRACGGQAGYITSVCSGALLLGAADLLRGYRATTHWMSLDLLALFGAEAVEERVVRDRNRITGGGVTAGIDFALVVASELLGSATAQSIQLAIEYSPEPPFDAGSPRTAPADVRERVSMASTGPLERRRAIIQRITQGRGAAGPG